MPSFTPINGLAPYPTLDLLPPSSATLADLVPFTALPTLPALLSRLSAPAVRAVLAEFLSAVDARTPHVRWGTVHGAVKYPLGDGLVFRSQSRRTRREYGAPETPAGFAARGGWAPVDVYARAVARLDAVLGTSCLPCGMSADERWRVMFLLLEIWRRGGPEAGVGTGRKKRKKVENVVRAEAERGGKVDWFGPSAVGATAAAASEPGYHHVQEPEAVVRDDRTTRGRLQWLDPLTPSDFAGTNTDTDTDMDTMDSDTEEPVAARRRHVPSAASSSDGKEGGPRRPEGEDGADAVQEDIKRPVVVGSFPSFSSSSSSPPPPPPFTNPQQQQKPQLHQRSPSTPPSLADAALLTFYTLSHWLDALEVAEASLLLAVLPVHLPSRSSSSSSPSPPPDLSAVSALWHLLPPADRAAATALLHAWKAAKAERVLDARRWSRRGLVLVVVVDDDDDDADGSVVDGHAFFVPGDGPSDLEIRPTAYRARAEWVRLVLTRWGG